MKLSSYRLWFCRQLQVAVVFLWSPEWIPEMIAEQIEYEGQIAPLV